jgi:predicted transcriptional regulator
MEETWHRTPVIPVDMDRVDEALRERGLNAYRLARRANFDPSTCWRIVRRLHPPTANFVLALIKVGIPLDTIRAKETG